MQNIASLNHRYKELPNLAIILILKFLKLHAKFVTKLLKSSDLKRLNLLNSNQKHKNRNFGQKIILLAHSERHKIWAIKAALFSDTVGKHAKFE